MHRDRCWSRARSPKARYGSAYAEWRASVPRRMGNMYSYFARCKARRPISHGLPWLELPAGSTRLCSLISAGRGWSASGGAGFPVSGEPRIALRASGLAIASPVDSPGSCFDRVAASALSSPYDYR